VRSFRLFNERSLIFLWFAIRRSILLIALLTVASASAAGQTADAMAATGARPVKKLSSQVQSVARIQLAGFEFQQPYFGREGPGFWRIDGEPSKGLRYVVEAELYGEEAIATAKFEAVNEFGQVIQQILIQRRPDAYGRSGFYGLMMVPDRPFRVVVSGEGVDGRSYRRSHERLFRPTNRAQQRSRIPPGVPAAEAKRMEQIAEAAAQEAIAQMENDLRKETTGVIVMPRTRVWNVMYAPYLSKAGNPLGVRITFDVEVSHDGYYNPELHLVPYYKNDDWRGRIEMKALTGTIEPVPGEAGSRQIQPHILAFGAGYLYRARTKYHFTAELVPDYVFQNEKKTKLCIFRQKYKYSPAMQAAWKDILASKMPTKYTVYINNTDFGGEIAGLHAQGELFRSFVAEGAGDCGDQPNIHF
jgi:hypothetical protein